jgi:hypothetical protein
MFSQCPSGRPLPSPTSRARLTWGLAPLRVRLSTVPRMRSPSRCAMISPLRPSAWLRLVGRRRRPPPLQLQFDVGEVASLAARYSYGDPGENRVAEVIAPAARSRGYFNKTEFIEVCRWKTPRSRRLVALNPAADVEDATQLALSARSEALRIGVLRALQGVDWATASVFLHFDHREPYPIIDFRALEALGVAQGSVVYSFDLWSAYVRRCRELAGRCGVDMRTLDRAMWQWSKERTISP